MGLPAGRSADQLLLLLLDKVSHRALELAVMADVVHRGGSGADVVRYGSCPSWPLINSWHRPGQVAGCVNAGAEVGFSVATINASRQTNGQPV